MVASDCGADAVFWWETVTKLTAGSPGNACCESLPKSIPAPWPHTYFRGSRAGSRGLWCKIPKLRHWGSSCLGLINHSGHIHQGVKLHLDCWGPAPGGPGAWARLPSADHPLGSAPTREPSGAVATLVFAGSGHFPHQPGTLVGQQLEQSHGPMPWHGCTPTHIAALSLLSQGCWVPSW